MKNPTCMACSQNSYPCRRQGFNRWWRLLVTSLTLGLAVLARPARADVTLLDDDFNNVTNNLANNDLGIGGGFNTFLETYTFFGYPVSGFAFETNGLAVVGNYGNGAGRANMASVNAFPVSSPGTVFEFRNVSFTNSTSVSGPNTDRLILGLLQTNVASDWFESGISGMPQGYYIEPNSDSLVTGTGNGYWTNHNSVFFYKGVGNSITVLARWQFKTLAWNNPYGTNYSPLLDFKITLSDSGWALNITGDVNTNDQPLDFSGTYAASGLTNNNNVFLNGLDNCYIGTEGQTEGPCIQESIDRILATLTGNLIVTVPKFSTPEYGSSVNTVYAGEQVDVSSFVTDSVATPTLQWQLEDLSNPGTFTNLPNGNSASVSVDTGGLGDSIPRGIRLVADDGMGNSVTSGVVNLTVIPASVPVVSQDIANGGNVYAGQGYTFSATFVGNKPMTYQWYFSTDGSTWNPISNETNNVLAIPAVTTNNTGYYQLEADNAVGTGYSGLGFLNVLTGTPQYLWSTPFPFAGLNADQVLTNFPSTKKIAGAMVCKNGGAPITVTPSSGSPIVFAGSGAGWASVSGGTGFATGANTNSSGNANFDTCLNDYSADGSLQYITLSNLIVGRQYQVQLFALDDRGGNKSRTIYWVNPTDSADESSTYAMGDHAYILGTFTASNTVQTIQQVQVGGVGNVNCLVLRAVGWNPPPYIVSNPSGASHYAGGSVTLTGVAAGDSTIPSPTINYQWVAGPTGGPYTNLVEGAKYQGTTTGTLTVNNLDTNDAALDYAVIAANGGGSVTSSVASITVIPAPPQNLLGAWFTGAANLADASGYVSGGVHDGYFVGNATTVLATNIVNGTNVVVTNTIPFVAQEGTNYWFTNDVPPGATGMAIDLNGIAVAISNSSTLDTGYVNTYDDTINNSFTVMFWAKGAPGAYSWNPWVSKFGDAPSGGSAQGWQFRTGGAASPNGSPVPCWTVRDNSAGSFTLGAGPSWSMGGDQDDLHAASSGVGASAIYFGVDNNTWHHYTGTYDATLGIRDLFVDGVLRAQEINNASYILSPSSHLVIGGKDSGGNSFGNYFTGEIYGVRIYSYAMNQSQIVAAGRIPPTLTAQAIRNLNGNGGQLVLTWPWGTLLEATNVAGPWVTNNVTSPYTNSMTLPQEFFRGQFP